MSELHIQTNNGFLQMEDLPQNCIFNKVVTGCGGTTIALFNEINYIIIFARQLTRGSLSSNFDGTFSSSE